MINVRLGISGDPLAQSVTLWNALISVQLGISGDPLAQSFTLWNALISVQFGILGDPLAQSFTLWNALISVQLGVSGDPLAQSVKLGNTTATSATTTTEEGDGFDLCRQGVIHELNKNCDVMKLVTNSLVKCHKQAVAGAGETTQLSPNTLVDGRYTHSDVSDMLLLLLLFPIHIYIIVVGVIKASRRQISLLLMCKLV